MSQFINQRQSLLLRMRIPPLKDGENNYSDIPEAFIVKDMSMFLTHPNGAELSRKVLRDLEDQFLEYEIHKARLAAKERMITEQLPELKNTARLIEMLRHQTEPKEVRYQLSHEISQMAIIPPTKTVCLFLGANIMLEYTLEEAAEVILDKMCKLYSALKCVEFDALFLCDQQARLQVTVKEVLQWNKALTSSQDTVQPPTEDFANLRILESKHE